MATTLSLLLTTIEAKLAAAPALGVGLIDNLSGKISSTRQHTGVLVRRVQSVDRDEYRHQAVQRVTDRLRVDLWYRIAPKDQRVSRDAAHALSATIRDRLTDLDDTTMRRWRITLVDEVERIDGGEWIVIEHTFQATRDRTVGAG